MIPQRLPHHPRAGNHFLNPFRRIGTGFSSLLSTGATVGSVQGIRR